MAGTFITRKSLPFQWTCAFVALLLALGVRHTDGTVLTLIMFALICKHTSGNSILL